MVSEEADPEEFSLGIIVGGFYFVVVLMSGNLEWRNTLPPNNSNNAIKWIVR
jgi:hypothetical protein